MLSRCCSKHKDCYFQYFKNVPLFNCSIIKNSCASSSQTNVSVMWENKLFFFFSSSFPWQKHRRTAERLRPHGAVLPPTSPFSFHHCHFLRITFVPLEKRLEGESQRKSTKDSECSPSVTSLEWQIQTTQKDKELNPTLLRLSSVSSHIKSSHVSCFVP